LKELKIHLFGFLYKTVRYIVTKFIYLYQRITFQKKDLEPAVKIGDYALSLFFPLKNIFYNFKIPKEINIEIFNLDFKSPLIGSSFKSDENIISIWLEMGIGGVVLKTIMRDQRIGNKKPRLQETNVNGIKGLVNSLGLPGDGINEYSKKLKNSKIWNYNVPVGLSIGGNDVNEYLHNIDFLENTLLSKQKNYFYELNVSCPNIKNGKSIGENPNKLEDLIRKIKEITTVPLSLKVSPDWENKILKIIGEICRDSDKILINAGNTQFKNTKDLNLKKNQLSTWGGGFSGESIFKRTLEMVKLFSIFKIPIIATGGINNIDQIKLLRKEGASLYGMATSLIFNPYCIPKLNNSFKNV
tara:strand:- start:1607 stop:2674 length:1068 start_codon:yes stop_codon:yes gene_type:complete